MGPGGWDFEDGDDPIGPSFVVVVGGDGFVVVVIDDAHAPRKQ